MKNQHTEEWEKEFDEQFGNNVVWWQECLAEMQIGDPDFNRLKQFIRSTIEQKERDLIKKASELHGKYMSGDIRQDIKDCKEKECDHYTLGADDFYHDLKVLLSNNK